MKNKAEIYEALVAKQKLRNSHWLDKNSYIHMVDGELVNDQGVFFHSSFYDSNKWEIYTEPIKCCWLEETIGESFPTYGDEFRLGARALAYKIKSDWTRICEEGRDLDDLIDTLIGDK
jgi:hypothetical protein